MFIPARVYQERQAFHLHLEDEGGISAPENSRRRRGCRHRHQPEESQGRGTLGGPRVSNSWTAEGAGRGDAGLQALGGGHWTAEGAGQGDTGPQRRWRGMLNRRDTGRGTGPEGCWARDAAGPQKGAGGDAGLQEGAGRGCWTAGDGRWGTLRRGALARMLDRRGTLGGGHWTAEGRWAGDAGHMKGAGREDAEPQRVLAGMLDCRRRWAGMLDCRGRWVRGHWT